MTTPQADKPRQKLDIIAQDARELIQGEILDGLEIVEDIQIGRQRWCIVHRIVVKRVSDGKFFSSKYNEPATESQEWNNWEYDEPNFTEVFPVEKTVIVYE